ncbi:transglutaminase-like domain-containing protein [uncultured Ferrovibrio sp.]|jgi:regulator of sirC expression with transglutaminase-like and TPR domain|uniref:SirB1 family protein n=1 Tax=uncultured Ferrovibrio sp. TaxID=1576913 RepID=UPI002626FEE9|nr:transglutaminase-like domain-containing protein [uncultured Ferrovibrio sp.]
MTDQAAIETALKAFGAAPDDGIDVGEAALLLAALDRPNLDLAPYRRHLNEIAAALSRIDAGPEVVPRAMAMAAVLGVEFGYRGDSETYDDPQNADLVSVIDRRLGLPVSLGILYIYAAKAQSWPVAGLDFPGHFLIRIEGEDGALVLDPFHGGRIAAPPEMNELLRQLGQGDQVLPEHLRPISGREVLLRLQNNIKARAWRAGQIERAAEILRRMLLVAPNFAAAWRELGVVEGRLGRIRQSIAATERFLMLAGNEAASLEAEAFLRHIRRQLN